MPLKKSQFTGGLTRAALLGVVLIGVTAGAMLLARHGPPVLAKTTAAASPAQIAQPPAQITAAPVSKRESAAIPQGTSRAAATKPTAKSSPVMAAATPAAKPSLVMAAATTPARAVAAPAKTVEPDAVVTLTGCLQHDDGTFRLRDTNGDDAPKSRSWKSGFLKKRAATVEVVDSANRLRLPSHVGQRVTVTGVLLDREMRARAVQRLGVCS